MVSVCDCGCICALGQMLQLLFNAGMSLVCLEQEWNEFKQLNQGHFIEMREESIKICSVCKFFCNFSLSLSLSLSLFLIFYNETGRMYFQGNDCNCVFPRTVWPDILFYVHVARNEMDGVSVGHFPRVLYAHTHIHASLY